MWAVISKLLGIGIPAIIDSITKEKVKLADAKTEQQKIESKERIDILERKKEIILNSQANKIGEWVRVAWALPFIVYVWKLLLWDKVLGWGITDPLSPTLDYILWTVLGGYFVLGVTDKFTRR